MHIPIIRLILAVIAAELVPFLLLIMTVTVFGPQDDLDSARHFAAVMGRWIGPIGGAVCAYLAAYGIGRLAPERALSDGVIVGVCVALIDVALLFVLKSPFEWIFVISNTCKIAAATFGGWVSRGPPKIAAPGQ